MSRLVLVLLTLSSGPAFAGFIEVGGSANYRSSGYDKDNYIQSFFGV
jgi:hypothetical protein